MRLGEHLLTIAMEECCEVAQRISKALRFGLTEVQPDEHANPLGLTNRQRIQAEYSDLCAVMELIGIEPDPTQAAAKRAKVAKFVQYADEQCAAIEPEDVR